MNLSGGRPRCPLRALGHVAMKSRVEGPSRREAPSCHTHPGGRDPCLCLPGGSVWAVSRDRSGGEGQSPGYAGCCLSTLKVLASLSPCHSVLRVGIIAIISQVRSGAKRGSAIPLKSRRGNRTAALVLEVCEVARFWICFE